eukprot:TRINITY_DN4635_c0_g1_i1.p1 TRINITY_DN4635_c0_g1~~TRINITY_DN4635_c0_g1_i1.p1  ORF type:complete len:455 (+),score=91.68 TRINITY_DN4635_c0_g1_i1:102-1367(+)
MAAGSSDYSRLTSNSLDETNVSFITKIASIGQTNPNTKFVPKPDVKDWCWRDIIGFWFCGLLNNFGYVLMLSAAEDMLPHDYSPAVVLMADIVPSLLVQMVAPYFMNRIPYGVRVLFVIFLDVTSFLIPAFFKELPMKLFGVVIGSIGCGFGEMTFLAYSSRYHKYTVSAWSSGTGAAGILGSFSYLGLRYVLSSKMTLIACSWLPIMMAVFFFLVMTKPAILPDQEEPLLSSSKPKAVRLPFAHQMRLVLKLLPYMIPLALVYFGEYLINQSITKALNFPNNSHFKDGKSYQYYQAIYQVGVFISRSSVNLFPIKYIFLLQLPAVFQLINVLLLSFTAVYGWIESIYVIFVIIFWEGLLGGSIYVNTFYLMSQRFEGAEKEFCLGGTSQAYGFSITMAAVIGIFYGPFLLKQQAKHTRIR